MLDSPSPSLSSFLACRKRFHGIERKRRTSAGRVGVTEVATGSSCPKGTYPGRMSTKGFALGCVVQGVVLVVDAIADDAFVVARSKRPVEGWPRVV